MTNPQVSPDQTAELVADFHTMREKALVYRSERDALQAKLDEANLLALSLQGQIVEMMAQPTIGYAIRDGKGRLIAIYSYNAIEAHKEIDPDATVTELIPRVSPL